MSESWSELFNQLQTFVTTGQWERVLDVGGRMLAIDPDQSRLHVHVGDAHREVGDFDQAEKHYRRAMQLDPDDADPHCGMCRLELARNRVGLADDHIHRALKIDQDNDYFWAMKAVLAIHHDHPKEAEAAALRALAINPDNLDARRFLLEARAALPGKGQMLPEERLAALEELLGEDPENDSILSDIGLLYYNDLKDYAKAEEYFRQALRIDPADKSYQMILLRILRERDPVLRFFWLPFKPVEWLGGVLEWTWKKKWPLLFMVFLYKYLIVMLVFSALVFFILFWPMAKVYECLTIADLHRKAKRLMIYEGPMARIHKLPFALRFGAFVTILLACWTAVGLALRHEKLGWLIGKYFAIVLGVCVMLFCIFSWVLAGRTAFRKRAHSRRSRRLKTSE